MCACVCVHIYIYIYMKCIEEERKEGERKDRKEERKKKDTCNQGILDNHFENQIYKE